MSASKEKSSLTELELQRAVEESRRTVVERCVEDFKLTVKAGHIYPSMSCSSVELTVPGSSHFADEIHSALSELYPSMFFMIEKQGEHDDEPAIVHVRRKNALDDESEIVRALKRGNYGMAECVIV